MFSTFVQKVALASFFDIELSSQEARIAQESISMKYAIAFRNAVLYGMLSLLPILFLDTSVIISVLIPITMVAGTAWFAISLANIKQKFAQFGLELTADLFEAFAISLMLLFVLSVCSLSSIFWLPWIDALAYRNVFDGISVLVGAWIIGVVVYKIFVGSMKYDINDSMLAGQNEAAERFYRKSLSLLHSLSNSLRGGKSLQVANYYIGVAFFEIFSHMKNLSVDTKGLGTYLEQANLLIRNPAMPEKEADALTYTLIGVFVSYCKNPQGQESKKSLQAIRDELVCLKENTNEDQQMVDTRFSIVFQEIATLLEGQGETLFIDAKTS